MQSSSFNAQPAGPPVFELCSAISLAESDIPPTFTTNSLLKLLRLDGNEPDGQTLWDRLVAGKENTGVTERELLKTTLLLHKGAADLIEKTNQDTANSAQLAIAQSLGAAVTKQIVRENDICPRARALALASTREDVVPSSIRASLNHSANHANFGGVVIILTVLPNKLAPSDLGAKKQRFGTGYWRL